MSSDTSRPYFVAGARLQAEDLMLEQSFQLGGYRSADASLHTWGIASGLTLSAQGPSVLEIAAGLALDVQGRQLVLAEPVQLDLRSVAGPTAYVTIRYQEQALDPLGDTRGTRFVRTREVPEVAARLQQPSKPELELLLGRVELSVFQEIVRIEPGGRRYCGIDLGPLTLLGPGAVGASLSAGSDPGSLVIDAPTSDLFGEVVLHGRLGVGTATPAAMVEVVSAPQLEGTGQLTFQDKTAYGEGTAFTEELRAGDTLVLSGTQLRVKRVLGPNVLEVEKTPTNAVLGGPRAFQYQPQNLLRVALGDDQPLLTVLTGGNVGIATFAPRAALHVAEGDLALDAGSTILFSGTGAVVSGDPASHQIAFQSSALVLHDAGDIELTSGAADDASPPVLTVAGASGNVGIGVQQPVDALTVNGVIEVTGGLVFPGGAIQTEGVVPIPIGTIVDWWRPTVSLQLGPEGFQICDGSTVSDPDSPLRGTRLPDLTNQFVRGVVSFEEIGSTGGSESHTHDVVLGNHKHGIMHTHVVQAFFQTTPQRAGTDLGGSSLAVSGHLHQLDNAQTSAPTNSQSGGYSGSDTSKTTAASALPRYMTLLKIMRIK